MRLNVIIWTIWIAIISGIGGLVSDPTGGLVAGWKDFAVGSIVGVLILHIGLSLREFDKWIQED